MCCLHDYKNIDYLRFLACRVLAPNTNSYRITQYNECHARLSTRLINACAVELLNSILLFSFEVLKV